MKHIILYIFTGCLVGYILLLKCTPAYNLNMISPYIAHGGGMLEGHITNSQESFIYSITQGFKNIELDLAYTSDSILVCTHDWGTFNIQTGHPELKDNPPTYLEFKSRRLLRHLTPMSAKEAVSILKNHPDIKLVTDKISDFRIIEAYFGCVRNQIIVECFSYTDYSQLVKRGFYLPLYSYGHSKNPIVILSRLMHIFNKNCIPITNFCTNKTHFDGFFRFINPSGKYAVYSFDYSEQADAYIRDHTPCILVYVNDSSNKHSLKSKDSPAFSTLNINHKYITMGKVVGDAFACGKALK